MIIGSGAPIFVGTKLSHAQGSYNSWAANLDRARSQIVKHQEKALTAETPEERQRYANAVNDLKKLIPFYQNKAREYSSQINMDPQTKNLINDFLNREVFISYSKIGIRHELNFSSIDIKA